MAGLISQPTGGEFSYLFTRDGHKIIKQHTACRFCSLVSNQITKTSWRGVNSGLWWPLKVWGPLAVLPTW